MSNDHPNTLPPHTLSTADTTTPTDTTHIDTVELTTSNRHSATVAPLDTDNPDFATVDINTGTDSTMGNTPSGRREEKQHLLNNGSNGHNALYADGEEGGTSLRFAELRDKRKISTTQYLTFGITPLIVTLLSLCILIFTYAVPLGEPALGIDICDILCYGPIISILQKANRYPDDMKTLVDMPLRYSPATVWSNFWALTDLRSDTVKDFINDNFDAAGTDVLHWTPDDYNDDGPSFMHHVHDDIMREWTYDIHSLWRVLGRKIADTVYAHPDRHTLLPLRNKHMMVPGGRFREFYYWDSYWIVRGLLASNMAGTARTVVENLLGLVDDHGFVPNGSRRYYLNRSQPPFLAPMVEAVYGATQNKTFLQFALPLLDKEYAYWMDDGTHAVALVHPDDETQTTYYLNRYYSAVNYPRPESYLADEQTAVDLLKANGKHVPVYAKKCNNSPLDALACASTSYLHHKDIQALLSELTASAESGWDFSSRWFHDRANLTTANTLSLIPVDLNSYMALNERLISGMHDVLGNTDSSDYYSAQYAQRVIAIDKFLWDATTYQWYDYNFEEKRPSASSVDVSSNFVPLYAKCYDLCKVNETRVVESLLQSGMVMQGGIVTSLDNDGQQWDYPNSWAPLQHVLIEGIASSSIITKHHTDGSCTTEPSPMAQQLGASVARQWLYSNFLSYNSTGYMMEKYYAPAIGAGTGVGGEYVPQTGFGWSNGVVLILLEQYGDTLNFVDWYHRHNASIIKDKYSYHPLHQRYDNPHIYTPPNWQQPDTTEAKNDAANNVHHHHSYTDPDDEPKRLYDNSAQSVQQLNLIDDVLKPGVGYIKLHNASLAAIAEKQLQQQQAKSHQHLIDSSSPGTARHRHKRQS